MKTLLSVLVAICILSCTKVVDKQPSTITSPVTQPGTSSSAITGRADTKKWPISIEFNHKWWSFSHQCYTSTWYCWQFGTSTSDNKSYIEIDEENQLIVFGIDNRDSSVYNSQFMIGTDFQFPQDTLNYNLTYAASGLKDTLYVNAGLYPFNIVDTTIVVKVPYYIIP